MTAVSLRTRLLSRIVFHSSGCMLWTGQSTDNGYGVIGSGGRGTPNLRVHRVMYEMFVGSIPDGLVIDHLCRVRLCCNPTHLEPVTWRENLDRGLTKRAWTHCSRGHEFTPDNTRWTARQRVCVACARARGRAYLARRRAEALV